MERREFIGIVAVSLLANCASPGIERITQMEEIYGLVGQMKTVPGKRGEVIAAMLAGTMDMPGNLAYLIAEDLEDENSIWITEVWQTRTDHANSLQLPSVQESIRQARPHIAGFGKRVETRPILRD
ncbi:MAG: antibiotic biosynthesis monooxygenase [Erythrobacter sp.]